MRDLHLSDYRARNSFFCVYGRKSTEHTLTMLFPMIRLLALLVVAMPRLEEVAFVVSEQAVVETLVSEKDEAAQLLSVGSESVFGLMPAMLLFMQVRGQFQSHYMAYCARMKYTEALGPAREELMRLRDQVDVAKAEARRQITRVQTILEKLSAYEGRGAVPAEDARRLRLLIWRVQDTLKFATETLDLDEVEYASIDCNGADPSLMKRSLVQMNAA